MFHNRYGVGYLFWKTGARATVTWAFCRPNEDVFNDFDGVLKNKREPKDQVTVYPHLLEPDDWSTYQGGIATIAWESLREGVDDYVYLHTLSSVIAEAATSKEKTIQKAAKAAEEKLLALIDGIPWTNPMNKQPFDTKVLLETRRTVADMIVSLQKTMAESAR